LDRVSINGISSSGFPKWFRLSIGSMKVETSGANECGSLRSEISENMDDKK
jgi:hypothetical protein